MPNRIRAAFGLLALLLVALPLSGCSTNVDDVLNDPGPFPTLTTISGTELCAHWAIALHDWKTSSDNTWRALGNKQAEIAKRWPLVDDGETDTAFRRIGYAAAAIDIVATQAAMYDMAATCNRIPGNSGLFIIPTDARYKADIKAAIDKACNGANYYGTDPVINYDGEWRHLVSSSAMQQQAQACHDKYRAEKAAADAAANRAKVLFQQSGSGIQTTTTFTVPEDWDMTWSYDCSNFGLPGNFIVDDMNAGSPELLVNELGNGGNGVQHSHQGGDIYLEINSECKWSVHVNPA